MTEGVAEREERRGRGEPCRQVVCAADEHADLAAERLRQHHDEDAGETQGGSRAARRVEEIERAPHAGGYGVARGCAQAITCRGRI